MSLPPDFLEIAGRIAAGGEVDHEVLLPYLCDASRERRVTVNLVLANAFIKRNKEGDLEAAKGFASRAWDISGFSDEAFTYHLALSKAFKDVKAVGDAYKRMGLRQLELGEHAKAFFYLHCAQYAHAETLSIDHVEFDYDVLYRLRELAKSHGIDRAPREPLAGRKVRLGVLLYGITQLNSIIIRIALTILANHDKERFEIACYIPESLQEIEAYPHARNVLAKLQAMGVRTVMAPVQIDLNLMPSLIGLAQSIEADRIDILLDMAALADYKRYFITCLKPAPVVAGFVLGPPAQFAPPELDFCVSATRHTLMETPVDCELIPSEYTMPDLSEIQPYQRSMFDIPDGVFLLASSGRHVKFQDAGYWKAIKEILEKLPTAHFLAIGVSREQIPIFDSIFTPSLAQRVHFTGWRTDNLSIVAMVDAVLDTYPTGGGFALAEPMAMGIPALAFRNDYTKRYQQAEWSPIDETVAIPDVLFKRGDFDGIVAQVHRLALEPAYRKKLGTACRETILAQCEPRRMVRNLEEVIIRRLCGHDLASSSGSGVLCASPEADAKRSLQAQPSGSEPPEASMASVPLLANSIASAGQSEPTGLPLELVDVVFTEKDTYTVRAVSRPDGAGDAIAEQQIDASHGLASVELHDQQSGQSLTLTAHDIYRCWACSYDFQREWDSLLASGKRPSIAFTVLAGSVLGGGTIILYRFAQWLSELGFTVTIYSNDAAPGWIDLSCRYVSIENDDERYQAITEDVVIVYSMLELLRVIRVHSKGKAILHMCQGLEHFHYPQQGQDRTFLDMFDILYALPVGRIVVSPNLYQFFAERYRQQSFYIPNSIDSRAFQRPKAKRSPDLADIKVLLVGKPTDKNKNAEAVLSALGDLAQRHPDWRLHFVIASGVWVDTPQLPPNTPYKFTLHRGLSASALRDVYYECDMLVNASLYEGFGLPSIEAMACGLPVVQGDNHGLDGIARDGENCLMVVPTDVAAIARSIERIVTDAQLRDRLVTGGYDTAAGFSLPAQFDAFLGEFGRLLGQPLDQVAVDGIREGLQVVPGGTGEAEGDRVNAVSSPVQGSSNGRPFFSILVPTYNHSKFLPAALDSLLAQTFGDWEAVVVNDGSTDNTAEILNAYAARDPRIRPVHKKNGGTVSALNEALKQSRGQWICWLSSDDFFEPDKLAAHEAEIRKYPETRFFFTNFFLLDDPPGHKYPAQLDVQTYIPGEPLQVIRLFDFNYLNGITIAIDRALFEELGGFNPRYRAGHDFDMWLRATARCRSRFIDRRLSTTRQHPGQDTRRLAMTGIIDSGVACLEFLNSHPFADLFPALDLKRVDDAVAAIRAALNILFKASSYIRVCGFEAPFINRMAEWLSRYPDRGFVDSLRKMIQSSAAEPGMEPELGAMLTNLAKRAGSAFNYSPHDPIDLLNARAAAWRTAGDAAMADIFSQYLDQLRQRIPEAAPTVLPVLAGGVAGTDLRSKPSHEAAVASAEAAGEAAGRRRILFVLHNFFPRNYGGVESYTYRLAKYLMAHGNTVEVVYAINSFTPREPEVEESWVDGIRVRVMHCYNQCSPLDQVSHRDTEALFSGILKDGHFDFVHFQHFIGLPFSLLRLAHDSGARVVATLHDFYAICQRFHLFVAEHNLLCSGPESADKCVRCSLGDGYDSIEPAMRDRLVAVTQDRLDQVRALLLENADLITVPSAFVAGVFDRYGYPSDRLLVAPLGIEPVTLKSKRAPDAGVIFGFAGNVADVKNFTLLVKAFKQVKGAAKLRFYGGGRGEDVQRLQDSIADDARISYHGIYKSSEIDEVFSNFDVLVQPSVIESYGLALREALSAGLPVIASRAGAMPEAIVHLGNGLLFESGNAEELTAWMQRIVDQPDLLDSLRQGIVAPLTIEQDVRQWEGRYARLLGEEAHRQPLPRIVAYSNERPEWACPQIRLLQPFTRLTGEFELVWGVRDEGGQGVADETLASDADLVVMQRFFPVSAQIKLMELIRASGKPVVLDIDDLITDLPSDNPHHAYAEGVKPALLEALAQADAVVCSSEVLKEHLSAYAQDIVVLPNAVDTELFHAPVPTPRPVVTLGLLGSQTHATDFALLEPVLDALLAKYGERLRIVFMGMVPERWQGHAAISGHAFEPDYAAYASKLKALGIDIALVPLADNAFNRAKSNIKWLEYSACGIAGVYSDLPPYNSCIRNGETGLLVANTEAAWLDAIAYLIENPERRAAIAAQAQQEVEARYSLQAIAPLYAATYRQILNHDRGQTMIAQAESATAKPAAQTAANAQDLYKLWQVSHLPHEREAQWIAERIVGLESLPVFHLAIIALEGSEDLLAANVQSLAQQYYKFWRMTVVAESAMPEELVGIDVIRWVQLGDESPLAAVNEALMQTEADWVGMIEAGDMLAPHALFAMADAIDRHPEWSALYSDEDSLDADGNRSNPFFKTDFNLDMLRSAPFAVGGAFMLKRDVYTGLAGFRPETEGVEYYDLVLRTYEASGAKGIGHIADVLYHRFIEGGHARCDREAMLAARRQVLEQHLNRCGLQADLSDGLLPGSYWIRYQYQERPLVSIIIPTKNQKAFLQRCLDSLTNMTGYPNYEILVVDNGSDEPDAVAYLSQLKQSDPGRTRVLDYPGSFNFSAMNNLAARAAKGEYLLLLNNDTAALHAEWLEEMLGYAQRPDVGVVGARLLFPNGTIQHAGVILGIGQSPSELVFINRASDDPGYFGRTLLPQDFSAVTGACLMVRRSIYDEVGGLDENEFKVSYNDIDLCLKVREKGYLVAWTPYATLLHEGSASQMSGVDKASDAAKVARFRNEQDAFYDKLQANVAFDPAYNRNLSLADRDCRIEVIPELTLDPGLRPRSRILAHPADNQGCGEYRIIAPMRALNGAGRVQGWETPNYLTVPELYRFEPDIIVLQRQVEWDQIQLVERYKRFSKAFRVFELDDLLTNVPVKSARKKVFIEMKDLHKRFRKAVGLCHRFVVSTEYLAEEYREYADEVVTVHNYIERARWGHLESLRRQSDKPRVGWAGGMTHDGDLAIIADVVRDTADEVDWIFFGMCPEALRPYVKEYHGPIPLDQYPAKLASLNLDLAVAPLEDVPFNHGKSHLRLLEYGILGLPVICTDITPYKGAYPVTRVPTRYKDWIEAIRSHVADMDALAQKGDELKRYIEANWVLEDHLDVWLKAWLP